MSKIRMSGDMQTSEIEQHHSGRARSFSQKRLAGRDVLFPSINFDELWLSAKIDTVQFYVAFAERKPAKDYRKKLFVGLNSPGAHVKAIPKMSSKQSLYALLTLQDPTTGQLKELYALPYISKVDGIASVDIALDFRPKDRSRPFTSESAAELISVLMKHAWFVEHYLTGLSAPRYIFANAKNKVIVEACSFSKNVRRTDGPSISGRAH